MDRKRIIEERLIGNGLIFREARLKRKSLTGVDRRIVMRVRNEAIAAGMSRHVINGLEMRGERGEWGLRPQPYEAVFKGFEVLPSGFKLRSYDVMGAHRLNGSTVGVIDLVHNKIFPTDMNFISLFFEYVKEAFILGWYKMAALGVRS